MLGHRAVPTESDNLASEEEEHIRKGRKYIVTFFKSIININLPRK